MSKLLRLLATAFDTKGYPDDKDPNHWRKINGAPVHIDANGNIDGGAGGKFAGKQWNSSKHPHNPAHYPKPAVTTSDLKKAWAKVAKYQVAMRRAKTQGTFTKQQQNMMTAIKDYQALAQQASPQVQSSFKPNVALANRNATSAVFAPSSNNQATTNQPGAQLNNLANATAQQNLQQSQASGNIGQKGRNVKIYNISKKGVAALSKFAVAFNIPRIGAAWASNDANAIGKAITQYLESKNRNYIKMTAAQAKAMKPTDLYKKIMAVNATDLNPTLTNKSATQRLSMALNLNTPPKVVDSATFNKISQNNKYPVIYRGTENGTYFSGKDCADDFRYGDTTWLGGSACVWGVGLYASTQYGTANRYSCYNSKGIVKMTLDPAKAKVIEWDDLIKLARRHGINDSSYNGCGTNSYGTDRLSMLAIQMGYNVIRITQEIPIVTERRLQIPKSLLRKISIISWIEVV